MIYVGIDDTDMPDTPGTNQLARQIVSRLAADYHADAIVRHQLLDDPRIPYTSRNGSASLWLSPRGIPNLAALGDCLARWIREWSPPGSDPGLCIAAQVPQRVVEFGHLCQRAVVTQAEAHQLARDCELHLQGLGGTEGGVIGALAAVGLAAGRDDGRLVHWGAAARDYSDICGVLSMQTLREHGVDEVRDHLTNASFEPQTVDVGKKLRPNLRGGKVVLFVAPVPDEAEPDADDRTRLEPRAAWRGIKVV